MIADIGIRVQSQDPTSRRKVIEDSGQDGIPLTILALQNSSEKLFIALKAQERIAIQLRGQRPQPFARPRRPSVLWRGLMRLLPPLARRWQTRVVGRSGLFDPSWYLATYADVKAAGVDPLKHYMIFGGFEARDPGPHFSSAHYLRLYQDVKAAGLNPLLHYLTAGWEEKRSIHPLMPESEA
jgi:hypothetical protein